MLPEGRGRVGYKMSPHSLPEYFRKEKTRLRAGHSLIAHGAANEPTLCTSKAGGKVDTEARVTMKNLPTSIVHKTL